MAEPVFAGTRNTRTTLLLTRGTAVAVTLTAAAAAADLLNYGAFDRHIRELDTNTHASIFGAISLLALAAALAAAAVTAARLPQQRAHGSALAAILAVLLALRVVHPPGVLLAALPPIAAAFVLLWWWNAAGTHARRVVRAGCLLLAASLIVRTLAIGGADSWVYQAHVALRHAFELGGWLLVATALLASALQAPRGEVGATVHPNG